MNIVGIYKIWMLSKILNFNWTENGHCLNLTRHCSVRWWCSFAKSCSTLCDPMDRNMPGSSVLHYSSKVCWNSCPLGQMPSNHLILCCPLLLLPSIFPSIRVFSSEWALGIRWPRYWSFSISLSNEYSELIAFRIDWFDLLAVQRTVKSLLQHPNWKASVFRHAVFFMVQLSYLYMTTRKTIALTV